MPKAFADGATECRLGYLWGVDKAFLHRYIAARRFAVEATVDAQGRPQAAIIGFAVTRDLELIFDTLDSTRKSRNLEAHPRIAFVIGTHDETTIQYEGIATRLKGSGAAKYLRAYLKKFPRGKERLKWPGTVHYRVKPKWIRYSDYTVAPPIIREFKFR